jgi:tRNA (mo5U34)-methyltransferase
MGLVLKPIRKLSMITLSDAQHQEFQNALKWDMAERLPDGRILGSPEKLGWVKDGPDHKVAFLAQRVPLQDKTVLELGSYEGDLTVQLARVSRFVTGLEVRPSNVLCSLARLFVHDITNARIVLKDVQDLDEGFGTFDVLFHAGILYHLINPIEHLFKMSKITDIILLNTHYYSDELGFERDDIVHDGVTYKTGIYKEYGLEERLSGVTPTSRWLYKDDMINLLRNLGYDQIEIARDMSTKSGPKITLLAQRSVPVVGASKQSSELRQSVDPEEARALEQSKKLFEAARTKAEYEEKEYRRLTEEMRERLALLERENQKCKDDNSYYKQYSKELTDTLEGITKSRFWRWNQPLRKLLSKII